VHGHAASTLLNSYTDERTPVIASMLNRSSHFTRLIDSKALANGFPKFDQNFDQLGIHYSWSSIVVDDLGKEIASHVAATGEVDAYTAGAELHAGDRAPNATGLVLVGMHKETSLFDLFSLSSHLGVVFIHPDADAHDISCMLGALTAIGGALVRTIVVYAKKPSVTAQGAAQALVDNGGHAFAAYKPQRYGSVAAAIVRPDGVLGAMVREPKSIGVYFGKIYA
jgi:hypothetical protein